MKRQFPSFTEALTYLQEKGTLAYFGRAGQHHEYCVYTLTLKDGRRYYVDVYDTGLVEVKK